jgi:hypothetical protein
MFVPLNSRLTLDPHLSKRALSNREKSRFCTAFISLVLHPLTRLSSSEFNTLLISETGEMDGDRWNQFSFQRRQQFMAMSIYLVPLDQVQEIIGEEFKVLAGLLSRSFIRLDTSNLLGDEGIVHCDEESNQYIDCWRRVAKIYGSAGDCRD